jgi:hypothetical protein
MMFKLGQCAEQRWRRIRGFHYLAKLITGVQFTDGIETTRLLKNSSDFPPTANRKGYLR